MAAPGVSSSPLFLCEYNLEIKEFGSNRPTHRADGTAMYRKAGSKEKLGNCLYLLLCDTGLAVNRSGFSWPYYVIADTAGF